MDGHGLDDKRVPEGRATFEPNSVRGSCVKLCSMRVLHVYVNCVGWCSSYVL